MTTMIGQREYWSPPAPPPPPQIKPPPPRPAFDRSEIVLMHMIASGLTNQQIAARLNASGIKLTYGAVSRRIARLIQRTGAGTRAQLVAYAIQWGVILP